MLKKKRAIIALVSVLAVTHQAHSADLNISDREVGPISGYGHINYSAVAPYGDVIVTAWTEEGPVEILGPIRMDISYDDGVTWNDDIRVSRTDGDYAAPTITISSASANEIFVAWRKRPNEIRFNYTLNGGAVWELLTDGTPVSGIGTVSGPSIAITENNQLIIVFVHVNSNAVQYVRTGFPGINWSEPVDVSPAAAVQSLPCVIRGNEDEVGIAWVQKVGGFRQIMFRTLDVATGVMGAVTTVSDDPASHHSEPFLGYIPNQTTLDPVWYLAFQGGDITEYDQIYFDRNQDGSGWGTDELVTNDARQPGIDVHRFGSTGAKEHIVLSYSKGSTKQIMGAYYTCNGSGAMPEPVQEVVDVAISDVCDSGSHCKGSYPFLLIGATMQPFVGVCFQDGGSDKRIQWNEVGLD